MEKKRLSKALAAAGVASRRACEELIFAGRVTVNGEVCLVPQTQIDLSKDDVRMDDCRIHNEQKKVYFVLNKPFGYICTNERQERKKIVIDLFAHMPHRLFTVGRLDRDTTGLLIVTNDGHFAQQVIHPSARITKEYLIKTPQEISHEHLIRISKGGFVDGAWIKPVKVSKVRRGTLKVIVKEGKKREVRVLVEKAGLEILELKRIRIGGLVLNTLAEGDWREMTEKDREIIFKDPYFKKPTKPTAKYERSSRLS